MYSSVEDLFKWEQSLYTGNQKKATYADALKPVKLSNDSTYTPYGFDGSLERKNEFITTGSWAGFPGTSSAAILKITAHLLY